jgi:methylated-DNA-[protein]-cysteine S-methyltransferase
MTHVYQWIDSPIGKLKLIASDAGLAAILWQTDPRTFRHFTPATEHPSHPILLETQHQLRDYFAGRRSTFALPLAVQGTAFQQQVWSALVAIPYGQVRTYGQIARQIGRPKAMRAVGAANGRNPIAIVAPCHRVLGASGALTGFAGGLAAKTHLLALEGARQAARSPARVPACTDLWTSSTTAPC